MSEGSSRNEEHREQSKGSGGEFGRGDRSGSAGGGNPEDHGGNYDPSQGASPNAFPSYGGSERQAVGGGPAGRGDGDPIRPDATEPAQSDGGTSGASSAIGDGEERRAASGASGSVSEKPTAAGGAAQGGTGSAGSGAMGNASGPNRTGTA